MMKESGTTAGGDLLIVDVTAITMDARGSVCPDAAIAVQGGEIAYVGPARELPADLAGLPVYHGKGRVAIPGLVNAHTHAAMTLLRGYADDLALQEWLTTMIFPAEAKLTAEDVYWGTLLACAEMIRSGTTCFADMYFFMDAAAEAVDASGIRASLSVGMTSFGDAAQKLSDALDFCRRWNGAAGGRITTMLAPHAPYTCSPEFIGDVIAEARRAELCLHTHLSETVREVQQAQAEWGKSPIQHFESLGVFELPVLAAHCVVVDAQDIEIMAKHDVRVAHNPGSNMKLASGVAPVPTMLSRGVVVGLGTDGAASNNNLDMIEEMRFAGLLHKVHAGDPTALPAGECLRMATMGSARCLRLESAIGSLEPGKKADIVLLDLDMPNMEPALPERLVSHLVYSACGLNVSTVLVDGRILLDDGCLVTIDAEKVAREIRRRAASLAQ